MLIPTVLYNTHKRVLLKFSVNNIFAILFFIVGVFSTLINGYLCNKLLKLLFLVLIYNKLTRILYIKEDLNVGFFLYAGLSAIIALLILASFLLGYPHIESEYYMSRYSIGITGVYKNPNYLTSFINVAYFVIFYMLLFGKKDIRHKLFYTSLLLLFLYSYFLSGTRASLLTAGCTSLLLLTYYLSHSKKRIKALLLVGMLALIAMMYYPFLEERVTLFLGAREFGNDSGRISSWLFALAKIKDSFLLGYGLDAWQHISYGTSFLEYLHNVFLEMFLAQGLFGLATFFVMFFYGVKRIKRRDRFFVLIFMFVTGFPMLFQNGFIEVNFWRFIILNRIIINYSIYSPDGVTGLITKSQNNNE